MPGQGPPACETQLSAPGRLPRGLARALHGVDEDEERSRRASSPVLVTRPAARERPIGFAEVERTCVKKAPRAAAALERLPTAETCVTAPTLDEGSPSTPWA